MPFHQRRVEPVICPVLKFLSEPRILRTYPGTRRLGSPTRLGSAPAPRRPQGRGLGSHLLEFTARGSVPPGVRAERMSIPARFRNELGGCGQKEYPAPVRLPSPNTPQIESLLSSFFYSVIYNMYVHLWSQIPSAKRGRGRNSERMGCHRGRC